MVKSLKVTLYLFTCSSTLVLARPEPPANNQYLPPPGSLPPRGGQDDPRGLQTPDALGHARNRQQSGNLLDDGNSRGGQATYEFQYDVRDGSAEPAFGHRESRDGVFTEGSYNVLLPDGRKQIVEYKADTEGYRPKIRYEGGDGSLGGRQEGGYTSFSDDNRRRTTNQDENGLSQQSNYNEALLNQREEGSSKKQGTDDFNESKRKVMEGGSVTRGNQNEYSSQKSIFELSSGISPGDLFPGQGRGQLQRGYNSLIEYAKGNQFKGYPSHIEYEWKKGVQSLRNGPFQYGGQGKEQSLESLASSKENTAENNFERYSIGRVSQGTGRNKDQPMGEYLAFGRSPVGVAFGKNSYHDTFQGQGEAPPQGGRFTSNEHPTGVGLVSKGFTQPQGFSGSQSSNGYPRSSENPSENVAVGGYFDIPSQSQSQGRGHRGYGASSENPTESVFMGYSSDGISQFQRCKGDQPQRGGSSITYTSQLGGVHGLSQYQSEGKDLPQRGYSVSDENTRSSVLGNFSPRGSSPPQGQDTDQSQKECSDGILAGSGIEGYPFDGPSHPQEQSLRQIDGPSQFPGSDSDLSPRSYPTSNQKIADNAIDVASGTLLSHDLGESKSQTGYSLANGNVVGQAVSRAISEEQSDLFRAGQKATTQPKGPNSYPKESQFRSQNVQIGGYSFEGPGVQSFESDENLEKGHFLFAGSVPPQPTRAPNGGSEDTGHSLVDPQNNFFEGEKSSGSPSTNSSLSQRSSFENEPWQRNYQDDSTNRGGNSHSSQKIRSDFDSSISQETQTNYESFPGKNEFIQSDGRANPDFRQGYPPGGPKSRTALSNTKEFFPPENKGNSPSGDLRTGPGSSQTDGQANAVQSLKNGYPSGRLSGQLLGEHAVGTGLGSDHDYSPLREDHSGKGYQSRRPTGPPFYNFEQKDIHNPAPVLGLRPDKQQGEGYTSGSNRDDERRNIDNSTASNERLRSIPGYLSGTLAVPLFQSLKGCCKDYSPSQQKVNEDSVNQPIPNASADQLMPNAVGFSSGRGSSFETRSAEPLISLSGNERPSNLGHIPEKPPPPFGSCCGGKSEGNNFDYEERRNGYSSTAVGPSPLNRSDSVNEYSNTGSNVFRERTIHSSSETGSIRGYPSERPTNPNFDFDCHSNGYSQSKTGYPSNGRRNSERNYNNEIRTVEGSSESPNILHKGGEHYSDDGQQNTEREGYPVERPINRINQMEKYGSGPQDVPSSDYDKNISGSSDRDQDELGYRRGRSNAARSRQTHEYRHSSEEGDFADASRTGHPLNDPTGLGLNNVNRVAGP